MKYRVYFNRAEDAPQVWSIDEGDTSTEINVLGVVTYVQGRSGYDLSKAYPEPKAWIEYEGKLRVQVGIAYIEEDDYA